jgi:hypothetical protein
MGHNVGNKSDVSFEELTTGLVVRGCLVIIINDGLDGFIFFMLIDLFVRSF